MPDKPSKHEAGHPQPMPEKPKTTENNKQKTKTYNDITKLGAPYLILIPGFWPVARNRRCWGSKWPPPTAKPTGKGGGLRPPPLSVGFAVGGAM